MQQRGRISQAISLWAVTLGYALLGYAGSLVTREDGRIALLWLPNGLLAAWLLRGGAPFTRAAVLACWIASVALDLLAGNRGAAALVLALSNPLEVLVVVLLMRRACGPRPDMARPQSFLWLVPAVLAAAALSAGVGQAVFALTEPATPHVWRTWLVADGLSLLIVTPIALIAIDQWHARRWPSLSEARDWLVMAALTTFGALLVFGQAQAPLLFLIGPLVLYAAFSTGLAGTAAAVAIVTLIASAATLAGRGPITLVEGGVEAQVVTFQLFLIANFITGLPLAAMLAARARDRAEVKAGAEATQEILDNVRDVIFRTDARGCWTSLNPAWQSLTGYPAAASIGWPVDALLPAEERPEVRALHPQLVSGALQTSNRAQRFIHADGSIRHVELRLRRLAGPDGSFAGTIGTIRDMTEEVRQARALAESEARFRRLAESAPVGIFRADAQGQLRYVNPAWRALAGLADDGWHGERWAQGLHPDDRARVLAGWWQTVRKPRALRDTFRWQRGDGSIAWVDAIARPETDADGAVTGFIGVSLDITERHAALRTLAERDAELTLITNHVRDAVMRLDLAGRCLYASPSAGDLFGVPAPALVGADLMKGFHPEDAPGLAELLGHLAGGACERVRIAYRARRRGTRAYRWLEANCSLVRDAGGAPAEIIASVRDVSQSKALEAELTEARARAEVAAEAKSVFLANMSHEIRTPMNGVIGFTELLQRGPLTDEQRRQVQHIADSGRAMMRLLNDILDLSRIEHGRLPLVREAVDVRAKLTKVADLLAPAAQEKGLALEVAVGEGVPPRVLGDALRLRQILLNLAGNAVKFTRQGRVVLAVDVPAPATLRFQVRDTGIGVPAERLAAIFQPFTQGDGTIAQRYGGSGLGLSISAELARLMGGAISAESRLGEGSVFTVTLPLEPAPVAAAAAPPAPALPLPRPPAPVKLLIVEDHDINRELVAAMARAGGLAADLAADGLEAIARIEAAVAAGAPYDLIFMDIQLPALDGLAATRRLRAQGITTPVIALTAFAYPEDLAAARAAGMQDHLAKPLQLPEFLAMIARYAPAPPAPPAPPVGAELTPSPALAERYRARKAALAALIEAAATTPPGPTERAALSAALHQFAGTAALFGDAALGAAMAKLDADLRALTESDDWAPLLRGVTALLMVG